MGAGVPGRSPPSDACSFAPESLTRTAGLGTGGRRSGNDRAGRALVPPLPTRGVALGAEPRLLPLPGLDGAAGDLDGLTGLCGDRRGRVSRLSSEQPGAA